MDLSVIFYLINYEQIRKLHWNWLRIHILKQLQCHKNINIFLVNLKMEVWCLFRGIVFFSVL